MVEASDHGYALHTRRIHVTRYNVVRVGYILYRVTCIRLVCETVLILRRSQRGIIVTVHWSSCTV
jgi:hypothetical protein